MFILLLQYTAATTTTIKGIVNFKAIMMIMAGGGVGWNDVGGVRMMVLGGGMVVVVSIIIMLISTIDTRTHLGGLKTGMEVNELNDPE